MFRLGKIDVPARLAPGLPKWLSEIACALASVALIVALRRAIDAVLPDIAPFALLFPGVLFATAIAGWRSGVLTLVLVESLIWRYLLAPDGFSFLRVADAGSLALNTISGLLVIAATEGFRYASRSALAERSAKLATRDLLLRELDHRVKNSFAMIGSLIELQRRRAAEPTQIALADLAQRVASIARAHKDLYHPSDEGKTVDLGLYLSDLCDTLGKALFPAGEASLVCTFVHAEIERDRVVALGFVLNELVTNAAKHAFEGQSQGQVTITLTSQEAGWRLVVRDNGPGLPGDFAERSGLGRGLIEAFAKQARADLSIATSDQGASFQFDLEP